VASPRFVVSPRWRAACGPTTLTTPDRDPYLFADDPLQGYSEDKPKRCISLLALLASHWDVSYSHIDSLFGQLARTRSTGS
jgi:hypothetical protein